MKILIINHNFDADIAALKEAQSGNEFRVVSASRLSIIAGRILPAWAFCSFKPEDFSRADYIKKYRCYKECARQVMHDIYMTFPFDVIVSPTDTIVYIRPCVEIAHELGVPFIVLMKETTVMPLFMTENAAAISRVFPFIGDLVLTCSERLKTFWLNAGTAEKNIAVTGQPRFDFYSQNKKTCIPKETTQVKRNLPTVLFLSYDVDITYEIGREAAHTWIQLRDETESSLLKLARLGCVNVLIKPHPQQQGLINYQKKLKKHSGDMWGNTVQYISEDFDARHLIEIADVVVGFQTTALIEAMAAKKKVVYTFWTQLAELFAADLLPFHKMNGAISVANSPAELENILTTHNEYSMSRDGEMQRLDFVTEHLGLVDGSSAKRCMSIIEAFCAKYAEQTIETNLELRDRLNELAPAYCRRQLHQQVWLVAPFWRLIEFLLPVVHPVWVILRRLMGRPGSAYTRRRVTERRCAAEELAINCQTALDQINEGKFFRQKV